MKILASLGLTLILAAGPAFAQSPAATSQDSAAAFSQLQALMAEVGPEKRAFVAEQLDLTEVEGGKFWPVYEAHQAALARLNERRLNNIVAYGEIWNAEATDDKAMAAVAREALAIEKDEAALLERTYNKLKRAVPVVKAVRYLQLESKLRALVRVELAARIPYAH